MNKLRFGFWIACCFFAMSFVACDNARNEVRFDPMRDLVIDGKYDSAIKSLEGYVGQFPESSH